MIINLYSKKTLLVHLVYNYIRGYIRHHNRCKDKKIIHISKQLLCSINKVYLDCRDIESLHLDDEDHPNVDFTNIKSLSMTLIKKYLIVKLIVIIIKKYI